MQRFWHDASVYESHGEGDMCCGTGTLFMIEKGMQLDGKWAGDSPKAGM
jgi:hypothetical protein